MSYFNRLADPTTSGSLTAAATSVTLNPANGLSVVAVQVTGTWVGTLTFEATVDGTNWFSVNAWPVGGGAGVTTATTNGQWLIPCAGFAQVRARCSAYMSGTIVVALEGSLGHQVALAIVSGDTAAGVADAGNPLSQGLQARTTRPAAVADGQRVRRIGDKLGRAINVLGTMRDLRAMQTTTLSASVAETTIVTAEASVFRDLIMLIVTNTSASTQTRVDFRDTTGGTVLFSLNVPGNATVGFAVPGSSVPQTTVNTNWTAQCSASTTDVRITAFFERNS